MSYLLLVFVAMIGGNWAPAITSTTAYFPSEASCSAAKKVLEGAPDRGNNVRFHREVYCIPFGSPQQ